MDQHPAGRGTPAVLGLNGHETHPAGAAGSRGSHASAGAVFVGRERELSALRGALAEASAGRGGVVAIGGEPGIGKTSLARVVARDAAAAGCAVLVGRCFDGDWVPSYAPWAELLGGLPRVVGIERLRADLAALGPAAAPLARLVPAFATDPVAPGTVGGLAPEEERYLLHEAVSRVLLASAQARPLLLVLDDLHWADAPSLALLIHLARAATPGGSRIPLLVVFTYRDGPLHRDHPLTATLAALRRETPFTDLSLGGLDRRAVNDLLGRLAAGPIDPALGDAIQGETGGNPFYAGEVMRHLLAEGGLVEQGGRLTAASRTGSLGVPDGVRQVVGARLARLSAPTRRLLDHAAVFTAQLDPAVLQELCGLSEAALLDALDEAIAAQFLRPADAAPERYEFAHAIVREALRSEGTRNPSRAVRLARQTAAALERVSAHRQSAEPAVVAELAVQYHASRTLPDASRGVPHALAAADQAAAAFSHAQAVAFLRIARDLAAELAPREQGDVLARLAVAEAEALLLEEAAATTRSAMEAYARAEAEPAHVAAFLASAAAALKLGGAVDRDWRSLVERGLTLLGDDHGLTWARLVLLKDPVESIAGEPLRASRWLGFDPEAVAVARRLGGELDYANSVDSFDPRSRAETDDLIERARGWANPGARLRTLSAAANDLQYRHGAFREALALWHEVAATAERHGAVTWHSQALNQGALLFLALGDVSAARTAAARAAALLTRLGPQGGIAGETTLLDIERETSFAFVIDGDWTAIAEKWRVILTPSTSSANYVTSLNGPFFAALASVAHARAGRTQDAARVVAALAAILETLDPALTNQAQNGSVALAADAVWHLGLEEHAAAYRRLALQVVDAGVGDYPLTSLALTIGRMATLLGRTAEAMDAFARARSLLEAGGQRPLRAIVDYDEAVARRRLEPARRDRVRPLFEKALAAFRSLGMGGWAERASAAMERSATGAGGDYPAGISEREAEVLRLIARGYADRQIAERLFISPRTVNAHVRSLLAKTERANRTDLSVWAVAHGLGGQMT